MQGIEVHRLDREVEITTGKDGAKTKFGAGSYVIRMDQPYSRMADMLLDRQYYNINDPAPYDDTGWSLGAMRNVKTLRVASADVLKAPMTLLTNPVKPAGKLSVPAGAVAYVVNHNADNTLATFRFRLKDVKMFVAEDSFKAEDRPFSTGSFIIKTERNPSDLRARLESATSDLGIAAYGVRDLPKVAMHQLATPRIALVHSWLNTQSEGWYRIAFDQLKVPYDYISDQTLARTPNFRERWDVILFGPTPGSAQRIVNGLPMRGDPVPWKQSELTPNLGNSPDTTDDMRSGMGLEGLMKIARFVDEGGLFITIATNASIPIDFGLIEGISVTSTRELRARGSVLESVISDKKSPIVYGYGDKLAIYFNQAPVFQVSATGGLGFGGAPAAEPAARPSGRGSTTDPDIPQGRSYVAPPETPRVRPGEEPPIDDEVRENLRGYLAPPEMRPRTVVRFADEKDLLVSGMLSGGRELANRPAVIDVPRGKGHVLLFANNPVWRNETQGSYFLLFNAMLNFDHLDAGRAVR
jgi:hypothetical protein